MFSPFKSIRYYWAEARSWLSGKDVFISYSRRDGADYALALASKLSTRFACVIDQWGAPPGEAIPEEIRASLRSCRAMVVVATRAAGQSSAVRQEIEEFLLTRRPIVPVDVDGSLTSAQWWPLLKGLAITAEAGGEEPAREPSQKALDRVVNLLTFLRRDQRLRLLALSTAILILGLAAVGLVIIRGLEKTSQVLETSLAEGQVELGKLSAETDQQRRLAAKAQEEAEVASAAAQVAKERAQAARQEQARAISDNFLVSARTQLLGALDGDPGMALVLAYKAEELSPNPRSAELIQRAFESVPRWRKIKLGSGELILRKEDENDTQVTRNVDRLLRVDSAKRLSLIDLKQGTSIAELKLRPGESLRTPVEGGSDLAILEAPPRDGESGGSFRIFRISGGQPLAQQLLSVSGARDLRCSAGEFPCFSLWPDGRIELHEIGSKPRPAGTGSFDRNARLRVAPNGFAVAILEPARVSVFLLTATGLEPIVVPLAPSDNHSPNAVFWSPDNDRLMVMTEAEYSGDPELLPVVLDGGVSPGSPLNLAPAGTQEFDPIFATVSPSLDQVAVSYFQDGDSALELLDLDWSKPGKVAISQRRTLRFSGSGVGYPSGPAAFAPGGRYLVVADSEGGGNRTVVSWLRIFDLARKGSNGPFPTEVISTQGDPVAHLAYSTDGSRLAAWHSWSSANIFQLRTGAAPVDSEMPLRQISSFLPESLGSRFLPASLPLGDPRKIVVQFSESDIRVYDSSTSENRKLPVSEPRLLNADIGPEGEIVLCGRKGVTRVEANGETLREPFAADIVTCGITKDVVFARGANEAWLYDARSFRRLATLSLPPSCRWVGWDLTRENRVLVFVQEGTSWQFTRWISERNKSVPWPAFRPNGTVTLALEEAKKEPGPTRSSPIRWHARGQWMVASQFVTFFEAVLKIYDFELGGVTTRFQPPAGGWPKRIEQVVFSKTHDDGKVTIALQAGCVKEGGGTCVAVGQWPEKGGAPLSWSLSEDVGRTVATHWQEDGRQGLIVAKNGSKLNWLSVPEGKVVLTMDTGDFGPLDFQPPFAWPERTPQGGWALPNPAAYKRMLDLIRLGGLDDPSEITDAALTPDQQEMVNRWSEEPDQ